MANPQKEDGYTPIANQLLEAVYGANFTATELKTILFIMRYTYGFSRKEHQFSLTFISKGVGVSKRYASSAIAKLIEDKVLIVVKEHTDTQSRIIKLNKNYNLWKNRSTVPQVNYSSTGEAEQDTTDEVQFYTTDEVQFYQDKQNLKQYIKQKDIVVSTDVRTTIPKFTDESFEFLAVEAIIHSCLEQYPNSKVPCTYAEKEKWANEIEKMKRIDNRTEEEIRQALDFAIHDSFWSPNIRSTKKFREKFESLYIQSKQKKTGKQNKGQQLQDDFVNNAKEWLNGRTGVS